MGMRNSDMAAQRVQECDHFKKLESQSFYSNCEIDVEIKEVIQKSRELQHFWYGELDVSFFFFCVNLKNPLRMR